eukprot:maker-scaffold321_size207582-snap-gene-1.32 protein:Tk05195 transcript:maker-scaffold321_size207582-snap-gene-1.32-mRNA-1 annotation:"gpi mannosyltransferase 4"
MVNWSWVPGSRLLGQAWDATQLAGVIIQKRKAQALVVAEANRRVERYQDGQATRRVKALFDQGEYEAVIRLFVPNVVVDAALTARDVYWKIWDLYWIFALFRILVVFLPQTGYVHPDEFFQTVEVVSGDVFHTQVERTWEFNVTSPIRSMVVPTLLFGTPLQGLKGVNALVYYYTGWTLISAYWMLVVPRLVCVALSFVVDYTVYQICRLYQHNYNQCLVTLASSYVMLIFGSRTFSNTIEMVLVSWLLYLVVHCMKRTSETVFLQTMVQEAYDKADSVIERVKITKKRKLIPAHDFKHVLPISVLCLVGFFNRPTFVVFALVPLFYWFQRGVTTDSYFTPFQIFNFRMLAMIPGALVTGLAFVLFDSLYYGELTLHKLWWLEMEWSDWKCTPLQFILYNVVPGNLDQHGTHPHYLHALVNIPLLFGPLGVVSGVSILHFLGEIVMNDWRNKPGVRTAYALTTFTVLVSLGGLSLIPHQEPRFLIPLIVPLIIMNAHKLRVKWAGFRPLLGLWYAFNILFLFFYGFIHQGGVLPTVTFIATHKFQTGTQEANVVFSHTYMPPKFPLLQPKSSFGAQDLAARIRSDNVRIQFHDLAGASIDKLVQKLTTLGSRSDFLARQKAIENFVVIPSHMARELQYLAIDRLKFEPVLKVSPHLSMESLPDMDGFYEKLYDTNAGTWDLLTELVSTFSELSLSMFKVTLAKDLNKVEIQSETSKLL